MGQLVTDGRLKVTAVGDEVNDLPGSRKLRRAELLASKAAIEQLTREDAEALSIDSVETGGYATVGEPPVAGEKATRDAASSRSRTSERAGA